MVTNGQCVDSCWEERMEGDERGAAGVLKGREGRARVVICSYSVPCPAK